MINQELKLSLVRRAPSLQGSTFLQNYSDLFQVEPMSPESQRHLLSFAAIFLNADELALNKLGYRILLQYAKRFGDFTPLLQVARAKELIPLVKLLERISQSEEEPSFAELYFQAYSENFRVDTSNSATYRTRGQMALRSSSAELEGLVVVAPTSYGKSEMMIERAIAMLGKAVCILVPSKALIAQTRTALIREPSIREARPKILTHPDAYSNEESFIAVMTQERLFRLMQLYPSLKLDVLLVDEAHNLLSGDDRNTHLAQTILAAQHRNPMLALAFYTPFVSEPTSLQLVQQQRLIVGVTTQEVVKVEQLLYTKLSEGKTYLYDQFLDRSLLIHSSEALDELEFVRANGRGKNVLYLYRPKHAEEVAISLARMLPDRSNIATERAARAIADLIHPKYSLIECLNRGVVFHHGKVPEIVRQYIESLYREQSVESVQYLVTTSTLLEGVNIPAETLFILDPRYGAGGYLTPAAFKNLIGRLARFPQIFSRDNSDIGKLQPHVYLINGSHAPADLNAVALLKKTSDAVKATVDDVKNPLLQKSNEEGKRHDLLEYLENVEPGSSGLDDARAAQTELGRLCFSHNVKDFDILEDEDRLATNLSRFESQLLPIDSANHLLDAIMTVFFDGFDFDESDAIRAIRRVYNNRSARNFYAMVLDWRATGTSYKRMVRNFIRHWESQRDDYIFVGSSWGDTKYPNNEFSFRELWIRLSEKSETQRVNLAVAKVKEEQDFVDYRLMPYIEILFELGHVTQSFYDRIQFGTDNPELITLLRNGISFELGRLLIAQYRDFVVIDSGTATYQIDPAVVEAMIYNDENDILVYETECQIWAPSIT